MTKRRSTKNALISSVLALVLCFTMLLGTTYAWFTDSVTSATNIIAAGNLDIELYHDNDTTDAAERVTATTTLFDDVTPSLWEPGAMAYEEFTVANEGSLALKYQFALNVANATVINGVSFAQMLKVTVVEKDFDYSRASIEAIEADKWQTLSTFTLSGNLEAGKNDVFGVVIWWQPSENDDLFNMNNANKGNVVSVEVGVSLKAAQLMSEEDSFGSSYDGGAEWLGNVDYSWYNTTDTEFVIYGAEQLAGLAAIVNGTAKDIAIDSFAGKTVKLGCDANLNNLAWTPIGDVDADDFVGFQGTFDGQNYTISNLYISSSSWGKGLFGYMEKNVTVTNVNVNNAYVVATDCAGVIVGYATYGTFSNINVTGNVNVVGTSADGYVGGIAGCGYHASFTDCSVVANAGSTITTEGPFAGGIVGYQCNNTKTIKNCSVENVTVTGYNAVGSIAGLVQTGGAAIDNCSAKNVVLNKTCANTNPSIGALIGCYSGTAATVITGSVNNVTLNGAHIAYPAYNVLYGSNYSGATTPNFDVTGVTGVDTITNNLVEAILATPATVQDMINAAQAGETVVLGKGTYKDTIVMKSGITLLGARDAVVYCVNLNGADNVTLKNINFDAAGAKEIYYNASKVQAVANIISSTPSNNKGASNVVIDGCTFTGEFAPNSAPFNVSIAFVDYGRKGGFSDNVTIKNCTFNTTGANFDIYGYYCGNNGQFIIENNTFVSNAKSVSVLLNRLATSNPVIVKGNVFQTKSSLDAAVAVAAHSASYTISISAADNTFNG